MKIIQNLMTHPISKNEQITRIRPISPNNDGTVNQFDKILKDKMAFSEQVKFSKHAAMRLNSRQIELSDEQIKKLQIGIEKAEEKGIRDSLVLIDKIALVVNVRSRTVVTAIDSNGDKEAVFTNIDGAVIV
ncbi:TIGR02530 family flagellar biosynthesis protein [Defluviitalea saccharophila]|uniref:TIGR02530 family flagellar biosynthesis protein n=1 Tax=Defluviitalea saccharophila TaxID=879970 RepID=A0ABZ2Y4D8_9FIRM